MHAAPRPLAAVLLAVALAAAPAAASAAQVQVNPILVELSSSAPSAIVAIRNEGSEPAAFELQVRAWTQTAAGEMQLAPTEEVVAFPPVLQLAPGEARNLRVGAATASAALEKSYRLFLQELPAAQKPGTPPHLRVLTRIGIPVFLAPTRPLGDAAVTALAVEGRRVAFTLRNRGTVHLRASAVTLVASDGAGEVVLRRELPAWYVLAAGERAYQAELPPELCPRVRRLSVKVALERGELGADLAAPALACAG